MRLGTTSLSVTKPGSVRKYAAAAAASAAANFKDIDQYSYVRRKQFYSTADACMACEVHPDGSKFYILQGPSTTRRVREFNLSTNFDISSAGSEVSSFVAYDAGNTTASFTFKPDGTRLFVASYTGRVVYHDLSTAWDISTIGSASSSTSLTNNSNGRCSDIIFSPDGLYVYYVDPYFDRIYRRVLTTAWDTTGLSTATGSQLLDYSTTASMTSARGIFLNNDGTKLFIVGSTADKVVSYNLSTAYDITSSSFSGTPDSTLSVTSQETVALDVTFDPTGEHMYIAGSESPDGVTQWVRT